MCGQAARAVLNEPSDVDGEVLRQVVRVGVGQPGPADDAGVVDEDVEPPELLDGGVDERLGARRPSATSLPSATAGPAGGDDLGHHGRRHAGVRAVTVHRAAEVVDHHAGAALGQQQRVGPADAAPGPGDDRDAAVEAVRAHVDSVLELREGGRVPRSVAARGPSKPSSSAEGPADHGRPLVGSGRRRTVWPMSSRLPRNVPSACG